MTVPCPHGPKGGLPLTPDYKGNHLSAGAPAKISHRDGRKKQKRGKDAYTQQRGQVYLSAKGIQIIKGQTSSLASNTKNQKEREHKEK